MTVAHAIEIGTWLIAGTLMGYTYFWMVRNAVRALTVPASRNSAIAVATYLVLRVALAAVVLGAAASRGSMALVLVLLGFTLARPLAVKLLRGFDHGG